MGTEIVKTQVLGQLAMARPEDLRIWSSLDDGSIDAKKKAYNATVNQTASIESMIGKTISVVHVVVHPANLENEETGEVVTLLRTILIDSDGNSYGCMSKGLLSDLAKIEAIIGPPPWKEGLQLRPIQVSIGKGHRVFKLELA